MEDQKQNHKMNIKQSIKIERKWRRKKKKNQTTPFSSSSSQHVEETNSTIFSLILAAHCDNNNLHKTLIKRCLNQLRFSLISKTFPQQTLPIPILSLIPVLLNSKCDEIMSNCAEVIGAASLFSFDMNEQIALDCEIVTGLISVLGRTKSSVSMAACNAILDLSTSSVGREKLLEFSALRRLIFCVVQVPISATAPVSLFTDGKTSETTLRIGFTENELPILLLDVAITLINTCKIEHLEAIPRKLCETCLACLKKLWVKVRKEMLGRRVLTVRKERHFFVSNFRTNNLTESIFRLSITAGNLATPYHFEVVKRSIFGCCESSFEQFIFNNWEISPLHIKSLSRALTKECDDIFSSFLQSLNHKEPVSFLSSIIQNFVSCPPCASDELDILSFLKEVRNDLGCPIIYQQDIRVLKTQQSKREVHFFQDPHHLYSEHILRCGEAYKEGYTVALRGVGFRFESLAAIADGLASLFGQPSAGANLYLTPPNSQGLARHCDDHCVLVCQLIGAKRWTLFPQSNLHLPRLYETVYGAPHSEAESSTSEFCRDFLLSEGDILYIPRGFPHEASTVMDNYGHDETGGFSLHLTLAIEVEPPFEWEGFVHVALHHWVQKQKLSVNAFSDSLLQNLNIISVKLLHVAIELVADSDPTFRKACLVASVLSSPDTNIWLDRDQRKNFSHLICRINTESRFVDVLRSIESAVQENEDPLQKLRWLQNLDKEEHTVGIHNWETILLLSDQHKDKAEAAFVKVKSKFCNEVGFEDIKQCYVMQLEKYNKARKQYTCGMLSLHCN